ncbi:hypothetical protein [Streptomyces tsukubensis]|uniref:Integral membrane protein n=1 Tax=Streptomyces tsukubensis TaxID=83656 RepID=A0A1V4A191_9ACTN|nr:hypothetical protein [Streptomyces tsukubensis]OON72767.1 hypothetical protein B1H18_28560 [Streptomyces tsukubensis]
MSASQLLRVPWLLAVLAVCAVSVLLARQHGVTTLLPVLLTASPVLPLLCVAGSYAGRADPFAEVSRTTPTGNLRLLLIRTGQVLLLCVPLLTGVAALLPTSGSTPGAAAWLLPGLALTALTLVCGSYIGCWPAALIVMTAWMLGVASVAQVLSEGSRRKEPFLQLLPEVVNKLIGESQQMWWALAGGLLTWLLTERRHSFNRPGGRR